MKQKEYKNFKVLDSYRQGVCFLFILTFETLNNVGGLVKKQVFFSINVVCSYTSLHNFLQHHETSVSCFFHTPVSAIS